MKRDFLTNVGQSLIEVVVAVGIIAVVLVGVSDIVTRSISLASFQSEKNTAMDIAQNQLSYYRQQRDLDPAYFFATDNPGDCVNYDREKYNCTIFFDPTKADGVIVSTKMDIYVSWGGADKTKYSVNLSQTLSRPTK
jgi:type II secretory pathway pseudopilin PulG